MGLLCDGLVPKVTAKEQAVSMQLPKFRNGSDELPLSKLQGVS